MGLLVYAYYMRKLFTKSTDLAKRYLNEMKNSITKINYCSCLFRVSALDNIDELSRTSCCLPQYIRKGIAMSTFILGRCLERGLGIKKDSEQAVLMYKKVKLNYLLLSKSISFLIVFSI
jgi:TPR repeat protein